MYLQCSIEKLVDIIADQVQKQGMVVFVWNEESATWKDMSTKSVATTCAAEIHRRRRTEGGHDNWCVKEQIKKGDKVENIVTCCVNILKNMEKFAKVRIPKAS